MYDKVKVSSGSLKRNTRLNLGGYHVTSMDFCHNKVVDCKLMLPGDKVNMKIAHNLQMSPPVGFTIGKCSLQFKSFFVPARLCNQHFENFIDSRETFTLDSTTSANLPRSYNHYMCAYLLQNFAFRNPLFSALGKKSSYTEASPWSDELNQPLYVNPLVAGENGLDPNFATVEVIGVCSDISSDGKPLNFLRIVPAQQEETVHGNSYNGFVLLRENDAFDTVYRGKDYDVIAPFQHITGDEPGETIAYDLFGFQIKPQIFLGAVSPENKFIDSQHCYPYVVYRFTELGKRYYDMFLSCGYSLNFSAPPFRNNLDQVFDDFTRSGSSSVYIDRQDNISNIVSLDAWNDLSCFVEGEHLINVIDVNNYWDIRSRHDDVPFRANIVFIPSHYSDGDTFISNNRAIDTTRFNMMKLAGLFKIYVDYLCPSYYSRDFVQLTFNIFANPDLRFVGETFDLLRYFIIAVYDKDYFSSSWQYPNAPTANTPSASVSTYNLLDNGSLLDDGHNYPEVNVSKDGSQISTSDDILTKIGVDALNALHKLFRIKGLAGSRYIDQLFARFGVKNANARLQRSEFIDVMRSNFDVSLVMSTSDTDGASLADYASHAESRNSGSLGSYEVTEWGYLYIIASIVPLPMYFQGRDRENLYNSPLDFFTPELDAVDSMQALRQDELLSDSVVSTELAESIEKYSPNGTFGYTRLWSEMKKGCDRLTGDFRLLSHGKYSNDSYHLFRVIPSLSQIVGRNLSLTNGLEFNLAFDKAQFDRIFQNTDTTFDHFMMFMQVDIFVTRNVKSMTDFSFDDECDTIDRSIKNGGTEIN